MKSMIAALGCVLGAGALLGALALSESRDLSKPAQAEQHFPEVCERYVTAFEACNADALKVSSRLAYDGHTGDENAVYIQRQLNQLRRELASVRTQQGEMALVSHCTSPQFEDINFRLVRQIASPLIEANAMGSECASAVGRVILSHGDPVSTRIEALDALEVSSSVASISVTPPQSQRR